MSDIKNILFIMCDQLRADYLSCYGATHMETPHLDALAASYPDDVEIYRVLIRSVLELAQDRGDLDEATFARFEELIRPQTGD